VTAIQQHSWNVAAMGKYVTGDFLFLIRVSEKDVDRDENDHEKSYGKPKDIIN
jgi:hypothetical protein